jgi:hypothetical protein
MKLPVTETGVHLPKAWFGTATEVEVRKENGHYEVTVPSEPANGSAEPYGEHDPIWKLGGRLSDVPIDDASTNLDHYLYGDLK